VSWEDIGFIRSSKYRMQIMKLLESNAMTPTEISNELKTHFSQITKTLLELEKRDLVKCLTPSLRKGRLYGITDKGKKTMKK
jgi:predicted transcriptional regulator